MKKVLITGFDPFGGEAVNPALEAVKLIADEIKGYEIVKLEVPTVFNKSIDTLRKAVKEVEPELVLCIGQAGGRFNISIERVAINYDDARIPDNEGNRPIDKKIYEDGENAYFSNLPIRAMLKNVMENDIPASISNTAGTFVCNHLMYGLLYLINKEHPNIKGGFIHVPYLPKQAIGKKNTPYMSVADIVKALECAIEAAIDNKEDMIFATGETH